MPRSTFPNTGATLSTITLSEAQMATLAAGNPVDVVDGVAGVIHVPISGALVPTPGAVPYMGSQDQFISYDGIPTTLFSFTQVNFGGTTPALTFASPNNNLTNAGVVGAALQLLPDGAMSSLGAIVSASVDSAGNYWVAGDQGVVSNGSTTVSAVDQGTKTFTLADPVLSYATYLCVRNGANRGVYTIVSGAGTADIVVAETIPSTEVASSVVSGTALITIDGVTNSAAIVGVNAGTSTITVSGDVTGDYTPGDSVDVYRNTGAGFDAANTFTTVSITLNGGDTDIVVVEDISALTADGYAGNSTVGPNVGGVSTFTVDDAGVSYATGANEADGTYGQAVNLDVTAMTNESSATGVLTLLSYDVTV